MVNPGRVVAVVVVCCFAAGARAAESDPFYGWRTPPRDGTAALNAVINERLQRGLDDVNRRPAGLSCEQVAKDMSVPLWSTALFYFISDMNRWDVDHVPRTSSEYEREMPVRGIYRNSLLLPFGRLVPIDPTVRVGDVLFGIDKLGHFFTNGPRYLDRYREARADGADVDAAEVAAVRYGVGQERGWLGLGVSGIFSYADLEANWRGLLFFRELCAPDARPDAVRLQIIDGRWRLSQPFDIGAVVDPCWDESFLPNAFGRSEGAAVQEALRETCPLWRRPDLVQRRASYRAQGCPARHVEVLATLLRDGEVPDPSPWSLEEICPELGMMAAGDDDVVTNDKTPVRAAHRDSTSTQQR